LAAPFQPLKETVKALGSMILKGDDPLGEMYCKGILGNQRRALGAFYTNAALIESMLAWVLDRKPERIIDAGCGTGRFALTARRLGFAKEIIAIDIDPLATLMTRANFAAADTAACRVRNVNFLSARFSRCTGSTAFLGNPPYVRHQAMAGDVKQWAKNECRRLGLKMSGRAGLHALFFVACARWSIDGDMGCFVTSAEWLDLHYGHGLRDLLSNGLGCVRIDEIDRRAAIFESMSTAMITCWKAGYKGPARIRRVASVATLGRLEGGLTVARKKLRTEKRWSDLFWEKKSTDARRVRLGSFARVHRGIATGANFFFVLQDEDAKKRGFEQYSRPCLNRASQIETGKNVIRAKDTDRVLLTLDETAMGDEAIRAYIAGGERRLICDRYLCSHRKPWWRIVIGHPPEIVATYMSRNAPKFAFNPDGCVILNVFHGIYLNNETDRCLIGRLVAWLNENADQIVGGRTYHGGLRKFEPREMEDILVPALEKL
jgi:SAM-dependent methyltransferase